MSYYHVVHHQYIGNAVGHALFPIRLGYHTFLEVVRPAEIVERVVERAHDAFSVVVVVIYHCRHYAYLPIACKGQAEIHDKVFAHNKVARKVECLFIKQLSSEQFGIGRWSNAVGIYLLGKFQLVYLAIGISLGVTVIVPDDDVILLTGQGI